MNSRDAFAQAVREWKATGRPFKATEVLARTEQLYRAAEGTGQAK